MRALWVTRWDYHSADDIRIIADRAADANFNTLYFQVRGNADALYRSQIEPWSALLTGTLGQDPGWDPLATAVHEAHTRGLEVHAWVNVYPAWLGETPPPSTTPEQMYNSFNQLYEQEWVMWNRHQEPMSLNKEYLWSNPGHFAVLEHIVAV
ncbi:MAG: family 10 glycosylhydrolase, partial [Anaerolineae bacterium]|nr:family 10 glycosylhydrolase [Anaerolineae bacterium]